MSEENEVKVVLAAKVSPELKGKVKELAGKLDLTESKLVENILETFVPDLLRCEKLGVFRFSFLLQDLSKEVKSWVSDVGKNGKRLEEAGVAYLDL